MTRYFMPLFLVLGGCAAAGAGKEHTYLCEGGRLATVAFSDATAKLRTGGDEFELQRVPSASGERYGNARVTLHAKDDEALLSLDGRELGPCQQVERKN